MSRTSSSSRRSSRGNASTAISQTDVDLFRKFANKEKIDLATSKPLPRTLPLGKSGRISARTVADFRSENTNAINARRLHRHGRRSEERDATPPRRRSSHKSSIGKSAIFERRSSKRSEAPSRNATKFSNAVAEAVQALDSHSDRRSRRSSSKRRLSSRRSSYKDEKRRSSAGRPSFSFSNLDLGRESLKRSSTKKSPLSMFDDDGDTMRYKVGETDAMRREKQSYLIELRGLQHKGYELTRNYSMDDPIEDIQNELHMITLQEDTDTMVGMGKMALSFLFTGIEKGNEWVGPILDLEGWSSAVGKTLPKFDRPLTRLYRRWFGRNGGVSPYMEITYLIVGSMIAYHFERKGYGFMSSIFQNMKQMMPNTQRPIFNTGDVKPQPQPQFSMPPPWVKTPRPPQPTVNIPQPPVQPAMSQPTDIGASVQLAGDTPKAAPGVSQPRTSKRPTLRRRARTGASAATSFGSLGSLNGVLSAMAMNNMAAPAQNKDTFPTTSQSTTFPTTTVQSVAVQS